MTAPQFTEEGGVLIWFVSTSAVLVDGLLKARMVEPFLSEDEAERATGLLNERFPDSPCWMGRAEYAPNKIGPEDLAYKAMRARADLAALLFGKSKIFGRTLL